MATKLKRVVAYTTAEDKTKIQHNADFYGLSVSCFLGLIGTRDTLPLDPEEKDFRFKLIFEIKKIGINLNQVSRSVNFNRLVDKEFSDTSEIDSLINKLDTLTEQISERI